MLNTGPKISSSITLRKLGHARVMLLSFGVLAKNDRWFNEVTFTIIVFLKGE